MNTRDVSLFYYKLCHSLFFCWNYNVFRLLLLPKPIELLEHAFILQNERKNLIYRFGGPLFNDALHIRIFWNSELGTRNAWKSYFIQNHLKCYQNAWDIISCRFTTTVLNSSQAREFSFILLMEWIEFFFFFSWIHFHAINNPNLITNHPEMTMKR